MAYTVVRMKNSQGKQNVRMPVSNTKQDSIIMEDEETFITELPRGISMKRTNSGSIDSMKPTKIGKNLSIQTIGGTNPGTPITTIDGKYYQIISQNSSSGVGGGTTITTGSGGKQQVIRTADGTPIRLKTGTTIKLAGPKSNQQNQSINNGMNSIGSTITTTASSRPRPTIFIKNAIPKKTICSVTMELIDKSPHLHLGLSTDRLLILKNVTSQLAGISTLDLYVTLKKIRLNEDFVVLAESFELTENDVHKIFTATVVKLAKYMKFLIRWPDSKKYYDRHKNLPIPFRSRLSFVQSLIECVETEIQQPSPYHNNSSDLFNSLDCKNFKYILTMSSCGVVSYVSDVYVGNNNTDDLAIFKAADFQNQIPKYLSLVADPGKGIKRKKKRHASETGEPVDSDSTTDSADETEEDSETKSVKSTSSTANGAPISQKSLSVVNGELTSRKSKNISIPTVRVRDNVCRMQIKNLIYCLREFKILQPYTALEPIIYQYINEILVIAAALTNLQR